MVVRLGAFRLAAFRLTAFGTLGRATLGPSGQLRTVKAVLQRDGSVDWHAIDAAIHLSAGYRTPVG